MQTLKYAIKLFEFCINSWHLYSSFPFTSLRFFFFVSLFITRILFIFAQLAGKYVKRCIHFSGFFRASIYFTLPGKDSKSSLGHRCGKEKSKPKLCS